MSPWYGRHLALISYYDIPPSLRKTLRPAPASISRGGLRMKIYRCFFYVALAAVFVPLQAAAQNIPSPHAENLQNCLEGFTGCDFARLSPQEKQALQSIKQGSNFLDCFYGYSDCNKKQLTAEQQQEVASAAVFTTCRTAWTAWRSALPRG